MIGFDTGDLRVRVLRAGTIWLDGGAMFGVVPRVLWERQRPPDDRHRIELAMHVLLVDDGVRRTLVDTGAGAKGDEKFRSIYRLDSRSPSEFLAPAGLRPEQIDRVVLTHLHFDHAGGSTEPDGAGGWAASFPRAEYVVQRLERDFAVANHERARASYRDEDWKPLVEDGRLRLLDGETRLDGHVDVVPAPGHTPGHQIVRVRAGDQTVAFLADLAPTTSHLPLAWVMGYDAEPLVAVESKRRILPEAARNGWWVVFQHDARIPLGRLETRNGQPSVQAAPLEV